MTEDFHADAFAAARISGPNASPNASPDASPADGPTTMHDMGSTPAPDPVPAKFRDPATGDVRVDDLARSYRALERRLSRGASGNPEAVDEPEPGGDGDDAGVDPEGIEDDDIFDDDDFGDDDFGDDDFSNGDFSDDEADGGDAFDLVPETAEGYQIESSHPWLAPDAEVNGLLHRAGFSQGQAQLVYDLAAEHVLPVIQDLLARTGQEQARARLAGELGGDAAFEKTARDVTSWGEANLPPGLYRTLAASPDGVLAMRRLMQSGEPDFLSRGGANRPADESALHELMDDPRYWRDHEPDVVRQVQDGFRRLYLG